MQTCLNIINSHSILVSFIILALKLVTSEFLVNVYFNKIRIFGPLTLKAPITIVSDDSFFYT